ncbi:protease Do-like 7 [Lolium perenne]|uniref:protease Do-like 7 n=1 Tax=Lolium perenne TaxID=4522 RepID=UPI0021F627C6|nr:protease Do-like 7 [Lolium perenne]
MAMEIEPPAPATADDWRHALARVVPAITVIHVTMPRAFDTEIAGAGAATGFVVDKARGIILTNRHVVSPGPVVAEAMFSNREEIPVYPLYRDPVHDFGFFRYNPNAIQFLEYDEIPLAPEAASVGLDIRVVGNDSGEKVSILAGTLARLDREAPVYAKDGYNDFNTFYMQAASGTKGGSSGSPVIDCQGRAVALNTGGRASSAIAFFLPLECVVRALNLIRHHWVAFGSKPESVYIPRGTLQVTFEHKGFEETRRIGLRNDTEKMVRLDSPAGVTGMLVVHSVVPDGPAHKLLQPGDVLVRMNGELVTQFLTLETFLDGSIGSEIGLQIERSGITLTIKLKVEDLHSITPNHFLEVGGAVIHPLSYQQARNFGFKCGLVYVAEAGYMLSRASVPQHSIIRRFAGKDIAHLGDLISAISKLSRGAKVPLEYVIYKDRHRNKTAVVTIDQHGWYASPQLYTRSDANGLWTAKLAIALESVIGTLSSSGDLDDIKADLRQSTSLEGSDLAGTISSNSSLAEQAIEPSLVMLEVDVPPMCMLDGLHAKFFAGAGVIIYHSDTLGLIAVDKNTVIIPACDIMISFAAYPIEIPGEVVFLHPVHNFAFVAYDPSALGAGASAVRASELFAEPALRRGDSVYLVGLGLDGSLQVTSRKSTITSCKAVDIRSGDRPRYRAINMEVLELDNDFGSQFSGVLTDDQGRVQALWASVSSQIFGSSISEDDQFVIGIPIYPIIEILQKFISGAPGQFRLINGIRRPMPYVRLLEVELYPTLLSKARHSGLNGSWVQALTKKDPVRRQVLQVKCCFAGSKAENLLEDGDLILAINKEPITCFLDIENACQKLDQSIDSDGMLDMTIFRQGKEIDLIVGTDVRDGNGSTRMVNWCGCTVQSSYPALRGLGFLPAEGHGVYVVRWSRGSPSHRYGLSALQWIIEVNDQRTPDLGSFIEVVKGLEDGQFVRVRTIQLDGKPRFLALKQDLHYWPTWELSFDPETATWHRNNISIAAERRAIEVTASTSAGA